MGGKLASGGPASVEGEAGVWVDGDFHTVREDLRAGDGEQSLKNCEALRHGRPGEEPSSKCRALAPGRRGFWFGRSGGRGLRQHSQGTRALLVPGPHCQASGDWKGRGRQCGSLSFAKILPVCRTIWCLHPMQSALANLPHSFRFVQFGSKDLESLQVTLWRWKWQPASVFLPGHCMDRGAWQATVHGVARVGHDSN